MMDVIAANPTIKLFDTEAKDCQKSCLQHTVPEAALSLFMINNYDQDTGLDAMTGALHACFPGVPRDAIKVLVTETNDVMARAEAAASAEAAKGYHPDTSRRHHREYVPNSWKPGGNAA